MQTLIERGCGLDVHQCHGRGLFVDRVQGRQSAEASTYSAATRENRSSCAHGCSPKAAPI
jgi:hypothetical protein